MKDGYSQGDMKPEVKDFSKPADCYAEKFDQAPLRYVERNDKCQKDAASKLKSEAYKGRYS